MEATEIPVSKELIQDEVMKTKVAKLAISTSNLLDKDSLNSVIVSLRPCIKQAKVHIIHNLTKQIDMLKKKKTNNEQQKNQNDRKINRFVEEISILKRTSKDVIGRWLLSNKKTLQEVTKEETLSQKFNLRLRVFARTGDHKSVRKVIDSFRLKYPLWEKDVPKIMIKLGKKRKKVDPNTVELGIKPVRDSANIPKKLKGVNDIDGPNSDTSDDESTILSEDEGDDEKLFVSSLKEAVKETIVNRSEDNTQSVIIPEDGKEQGESVVKVFDLEHDTFDQIKSNKSLNHEQENKISKHVSSFFVGGESDEEAHGDSDFEDDFDNDLLSNQDDIIAKYRGKGLQMKERGSFQSNRFSRKNTNLVKSTQKQHGIAHAHEKKIDKEHLSSKRLPSKSSEDDVSGSSLHPSWAAKKRANISIAKFEGKKIKFGDENNPVSTVTSTSKSQQISEEKLHPSWTAKQNLKSTIQAFQGKKTLFED